MNEMLNNDKSQIDELLQLTKDHAIDFFNGLDNRTTSPKNTVRTDLELNSRGLGSKASLELFIQRFEKIISASSGPRYWGFVTGGTTPASIMGDWLASIYDQNTQSTKGEGDISAQIEIETINLLLDLFRLPKGFMGGFLTGATMSNFTCLAVARQWVGKQLGFDIAKQGVKGGLTILSATPHSSTIKSLSMLGIGSSNLIRVKTVAENSEAINIEDLKVKIKKLEGAPFILVSSAGTVNTVDFDDFEEIAKLKQKHNFWWHIDAAFGGFAACSPMYSYLVKGWEEADSITIDNHKWLNVPYESAIYLVKEEYKLLQIETFQNSNAPYLGDPMKNFNYLNFLPENSRRLKALPAWFSLKAYGKKGYQKIVENSVARTKQLGAYLDSDPKFILLAPVILNTVCFTLADTNKSSSDFLYELNKTGDVFMSPTTFNGKKGIRAAFVNWRTTKNDVKMVIELLKKT